MLNGMSFCLGLNDRLLQNDMSFSNICKTTCRFGLKTNTLPLLEVHAPPHKCSGRPQKTPNPDRNCREIRRGRLCSWSMHQNLTVPCLWWIEWSPNHHHALKGRLRGYRQCLLWVVGPRWWRTTSSCTTNNSWVLHDHGGGAKTHEHEPEKKKKEGKIKQTRNHIHSDTN
jgi:hypothetical protein